MISKNFGSSWRLFCRAFEAEVAHLGFRHFFVVAARSRSFFSENLDFVDVFFDE